MLFPKIERILVPLDGSLLSENALPLAAALAQKCDAQIILLRVMEPVPGVEHVSYPGARHLLAQYAENLKLEAADYLYAHQAQLEEAGLGVEIRLLAGAAAAKLIIDAAADLGADLVVMSTHGRGGIARWTAGSVADKVLRYSSCPVLLVRQGLDQA